MGYEGEGLATAKKAATDGISFLKTATGMAKTRTDVAEQPAPMTVAPPVRMSRGQGPTVISLNVEINGTVNSPDELHIYGKIDGNVRAASVTVCEGGSVTGDVMAESITINGKVEGRLYGKRVHLQAAAVVHGDIFHSALGVDSAAVFEGASRRVADPLAETMPPVAANAA